MNARRFWILYAILIALFVAEVPLARSEGFVLGIYIAITSVGYLGVRAAPIVLALALAALLVPVAIPSWHQTIGDTWGDVTPIGIPIAGITIFVMLQVLRSNRQLAEARADVARLAAENERIRIARDLHDLLGHSLTTITVKAGLAARLGEANHERALQEIAEVETLARQTLGEMRAAVVGYREVSLAGELATGRELLRAAGIAADLPHAVDVVDPAHQELFGWVVREGLTNVVRHARAKTCAVRLSACEVEIVDDGVGRAAAPGNGLTGLRERVAAADRMAAVGHTLSDGRRTMIRLLLADDQELIRSALALLLDLQEDFEVVASVGRGDEVLAAARAHQPDVALLDIDMPGIDGLAAAGVLAKEVPQCRSLILTTFGRPGYLRRAMESGAYGFVVKDAPPEQLADAVRRVAAGERVVDPALAAATLASGASPLSARERDVLVAARPGATVTEIADKLCLSEGTIRNYLSTAIAKTGTRNRTEAVRLADERGWL